MIEKTKKVYYCEFCGKHYIHKGYAKYHEKWCAKNPKMMRPCMNCIHLSDAEVTAYRTGYNGYTEEEWEFKVKCMKCDITSKIFYHPRIERTQWFKEFGVTEEQKPMPKKCNMQLPIYDKIYNSIEELEADIIF